MLPQQAVAWKGFTFSTDASLSTLRIVDSDGPLMIEAKLNTLRTQTKWCLAQVKPGTLILTMYFLWSKGENKLHFSIFWESVVCRKGIKKKGKLICDVQQIKKTAALVHFDTITRSLQQGVEGWLEYIIQIMTTGFVSQSKSTVSVSHLWRSRRARPCQRRSPGHAGHRCETAPGKSRPDTGCGSACGSTWAAKGGNSGDKVKPSSRGTFRYSLVLFTGGWRNRLDFPGL